MNKIVEYKMALSNGRLNELNQETNALIQQGFQPFGGIAVTVDNQTVYFAQAMVRYFETEKQAVPTPIYKT